MKLIDVLATELNRWPDKRATAMQSGEDEEIYFDGGSPDDFYVDTRASDGGLAGAVVTRQEWEAAVAARLTATSNTPTLETMLTEWRDLEARAQAAQAEADALFEHAGQCHGEIVVRLAELGWGAPRGRVVTLDELECCKPTDDERQLLANGDYTPEELWGGNRPTCPKCINRPSTQP